MRRIPLLFACGALAFAAVACASDDREPRVIRVPTDAPSLEAAVKRAQPGDLILLAPGTYHESVEITAEDITVRGEDRNTVVLDGRFELDDGIVGAGDGIAVENLTVKNYLSNGVLISADYEGQGDVPPLRRYRVAYVTAANNGLYGIYAFASLDGVIEHSYASGTAGAGIYVGQCKPCRSVVRNVVAERNALGYQAANASGDAYVVESVFRNNRAGVVTLSETLEELAPQIGGTFAANLVENNNAGDAPTAQDAQFGVGIVVAGGQENVVTANVVRGHAVAGVLVTGNGDFLPQRNRVESNQVAANGVDLAYVLPGRPDVMAMGNCFAGNRFDTANPDAIEAQLPCSGARPGPFATAGLLPVTVPAAPDYRTVPLPAPQPNRPGDPAALPRRVTGAPAIDLGALRAPSS